jgi:hypothetical protein
MKLATGRATGNTVSGRYSSSLRSLSPDSVMTTYQFDLNASKLGNQSSFMYCQPISLPSRTTTTSVAGTSKFAGGNSDDPTSQGTQRIEKPLPKATTFPLANDSSITNRFLNRHSLFKDSQNGSRLPKVQAQGRMSFWRQDSVLMKISTFASWFCVLDCTLLPIMTGVLPLLGLASFTAAQSLWMHEMGHTIALHFVMPVGFLASSVNYLCCHGRKQLLGMAWAGLILIFMANVGCDFAHSVEDVLPRLLGTVIHNLLHRFHEGWEHRLCNAIGCSLLLGSNYLAHQQNRITADRAIRFCRLDGCCDPSKTEKQSIVFERKQQPPVSTTVN